jgi:8-oxo-dGTP pyrophosphatase MutT (NUDIX family)
METSSIFCPVCGGSLHISCPTCRHCDTCEYEDGGFILPVGTGVFLVTPDFKSFWMSKRKPGLLHAGCWQLPGGSVEPKESVEVAARREILEETGIELGELSGPVFNGSIVRPNGEKYWSVQYFVVTKQTPQDMEPEKHGPWQLFTWGEAKTVLCFGALHHLLQSGMDETWIRDICQCAFTHR